MIDFILNYGKHIIWIITALSVIAGMVFSLCTVYRTQATLWEKLTFSIMMSILVTILGHILATLIVTLIQYNV